MATGLERIHGSFDRLERFFSKKRRPSPPPAPPPPPSRSFHQRDRPTIPRLASTGEDWTQQTFPQPSFMRPRSNRMIARDEVAELRPSRRTKSLPESQQPADGAVTSSASVPDIPPVSLARRRQLSDSSQDPDYLDAPEFSNFSFSLDPFGDSSRSSRSCKRPSSLVRPESDEGAPTSVPPSPKTRPERKPHAGQIFPPGPKTCLLPPDTPPQSDQDDKFSVPIPANRNKQLPPVPQFAELTPEPSPKLAALPELAFDIFQPDQFQPDQSRPDPVPVPQRSKSLDDMAVTDAHSATPKLRRTFSDSTLPGADASCSFEPGPVSGFDPTGEFNPILAEPTFAEFLSLSDDDIADERPPTPLSHSSDGLNEGTTPGRSLPPSTASSQEDMTGHHAATPRVRAPSASPSQTNGNMTGNVLTRSQKVNSPLPSDPVGPFRVPQYAGNFPLVTPSPPLAVRPASAAAFEAARIANTYHFDLVYLVNLWPSQANSVQPTSYSAQVSPTAPFTLPSNSLRSLPTSPLHAPSQAKPDGRYPRAGLTGRLLAGHGLQLITRPFSISEPVHLKALRTDGWLEYRNSASNELSRGYICSFYTGYKPGGRRWRSTYDDYEDLAVNHAANTGAASPSSQIDKRERQLKKERLERPRANRGIVFAAYRSPRPDGTNHPTDKDELARLREEAERLADMVIDIHHTQRRTRRLHRAATVAKGAPTTPEAITTVRKAMAPVEPAVSAEATTLENMADTSTVDTGRSRSPEPLLGAGAASSSRDVPFHTCPSGETSPGI